MVEVGDKDGHHPNPRNDPVSSQAIAFQTDHLITDDSSVIVTDNQFVSHGIVFPAGIFILLGLDTDMPMTTRCLAAMVCVLLAGLWASPVTAAEPSAWPSAEKMLGDAAAGHWAKYDMTQQTGSRSQSATAWMVYKGKEGNAYALTQILSSKGDASETPPADGAAGTRANTTKLAGGDTFPPLQLPPGTRIVSEHSTQSAFADLQVSGKSYNGVMHTRTLETELTNGAKLTYITRIWVSPAVALGGMVKLTAETTGFIQTRMEMNLLACHPAVPQGKVNPEGKADDEPAIEISIGKPEDLLTLSEKFAIAGWELGSDGKPKIRRRVSPEDAFNASLAITAAEMGFPNWALKARMRLEYPARHVNVTEDAGKAFIRDGRREYLVHFGLSQREVEGFIRKHETQELLDGLPDSLGGYVVLLRQTPSPNERYHLIGRALRSGRLRLEQMRKLLAMIPNQADRTRLVRSTLLHAGKSTNDPAHVETLASLDDSLVDSELMMACVASAQLRAGQIEPAKLAAAHAGAALLAQSRAVLKETETRNERTDITRLLSDFWKELRSDQYLPMEREMFHALAYSTRLAVEKNPSQAASPYVAPHLVREAAMDGDREKALAAMNNISPGHVYNEVTALVTYYAHSGRYDEAIEWYESLQAEPELLEKGQLFRTMDLKSAVALGFAEHHWLISDDAGFERWIKQAIDLALAANVQSIQWNAQNKPRAFWSRGALGSGPETQAPYERIGLFLIKHPTQANNARLLAMLKQLQDEMPVSASVRDLWRDMAIKAGQAGEHALLVDLFQSLPKDWSPNWRTDIYVSATIPIAAKLEDATQNVARIRALTATVSDSLGLQAEILRSAIIELVAKDCLQDAQTLMTDIKQATAAGAFAKHQAFAAVAIARGHAKRGQWEQALAAFNDRSMGLDESMPVRGVNGRNWVNYLYDIGVEIGRSAASPDMNNLSQYEVARNWIEGVKDLRERAAITLGMASGYDHVQNDR